MKLAWLQLSREKLRLLVALAGVAFAVILILMQLAFRQSVFDSAIRYHEKLDYDLAMINPKTPFIGFPESFTWRRLYQALGAAEVESVTPIYLEQAFWEDPWEHDSRPIFVIGIDPRVRVFNLPAIDDKREAIRLPDVALFDVGSRPEFGPVAAKFAEQGSVVAEVNDRRITVAGLYRVGSSFGIDGSLVTSDLNFRRLFPNRPPGLIDLGLIRLRPGANPEQVRRQLVTALERDVEILSRESFVAREIDYWNTTTPAGYIFTFGAIMGLVVGGVIVYQILFADVSDHLAEYATLKAMGYTNASLSAVVLHEALIVAVLGFIPGLLACFFLYDVTAEATRLPLEMTAQRAGLVLLLTIAMCALAALIALRKIRAADPAEVF
jgi:putative ABC transport system permease protein